jgi:hypothetical protein
MKPFVIAIAVVLAVTSLTPSAQTKRASAPAGGTPFTVVEASISEMRTAMEQGQLSSRELVTQYLVRIAIYEDTLHAALTVNRDAPEIAAERTGSARKGRSVGCTSDRVEGQRPHDDMHHRRRVAFSPSRLTRRR